MNIGITGSRGFIGKHLVEALRDKKNIRLSLFDLPKYNLLRPASLKNFVRNKDVIIHTAAVNHGTDEEIISGSVVATYNLISAVKKLKKRPKLIFLSSIQSETDTLYGKSKWLAEIMLEDFSKRTKTPITIFRLTNVFGEGCRPFYNSVAATFCYQIANDQEIKIKVDNKIRFIYVKDLVRMLIKEVMIRRKKLFFLKRISSKNEILVSKLAKLIQSFKNFKTPAQLKNKFYRDLYKTYLSYAQ